MPYRDAALLLLGHGSTLNADSSAPTYQHAEEIRGRQLFAEVHVGFWKEEANFRQALRQTRCARVYVVPNFISSGYFTEQVIPRELELKGPITRIGEQEVLYCEPVGLHPSMTGALLQRAHEVVAQSQEKIVAPAKTACLFICGHGTSLNDNSTKIIHDQAAMIRERGLFADCQAVLMEQRPFVKDWRTLTDCPDVIVVPFFIADGLHSFEDIPVLLGLTHDIKQTGFTNPHREDGRRLWYSSAIGTEPSITEVILNQVDEFEKKHTITPLIELFVGEPFSKPVGEFLKSAPQPWIMGEVALRQDSNSPSHEFHLLHKNDIDSDASTLREIRSFAELRELIRLDQDGNFRPLRAAPNLRSGWRFSSVHLSDILLALDYIYPAEIANWALWKEGALATTPWAVTAERQSGRFRIVREIDDAGIQELVQQVCERGCLKRRLWSPASQKIESNPNEIPLPCPEACNYLVAKAREKLKGGEEEND